MKDKKIRIAYIHTITYPSVLANALQAIKTASALSNTTDTTFFIPGLLTSKSKLKQHYDICESPLHLSSMYLDKIPVRLRSGINNFYEKLIALNLRFSPHWAAFQGRKVLYVRIAKELLFWGEFRERNNWLKDWILIFEAHDALGFDTKQSERINPFDLKDGSEGAQRQSILKSLRQFDQIVCVTETLSKDLQMWTGGAVQPHVIQQASSIPRLINPPQICFSENIVLGYVGTIDRFRGVDILLDAMQYLPQNYRLRLVGRSLQEEGTTPNWILDRLKDPLVRNRVEWIRAVPIGEVAGEIDQCDILLQPASADVMYSRYASPLKSYDAMMRGKPIIAADIPGHRRLFLEGKSASFYSLNPRDLAECVLNLVSKPEMAQGIAASGWEQAAEFTYPQRAGKILSLVEDCWHRRAGKNL